MNADQVQVKRIYDQPSPSDGERVLVDRLWPRGISKERAALSLRLKDIAPSTDLRRWYSHDPAKFAEFTRRYKEELTHPPAADALAELRKLAASGPVTLLTASKQADISEAAVLSAVLSSTTAD